MTPAVFHFYPLYLRLLYILLYAIIYMDCRTAQNKERMSCQIWGL